MFGGSETLPAVPKTLLDIQLARDNAIKTYQGAVDMIKESKRSLGDYIYPNEYDIKDWREDFTKKLDENLWRYAFQKTGLERYMDAKARQDFERSLSQKVPEFTVENIKSIVLGAAQDAEMMFARGIVNTFHRLSDDHKTNTNKPFTVNEKAIIKHVFTLDYCGGLSVSWHSADMLSDIDRVVKVLDGQKFEPHSLRCQINDSFKLKNTVYEDEYYRIKGHKNGNAHIEFKRKDILDKINLIIAKFYGDNNLVGHPKN